MARKRNNLRIIGGNWRSRRIQFADVAGVRPTPERVRETLFNWLSTKIVGAHCLDLFAGSGALGFEAASRGANSVMQVDCNAEVVDMLGQQKLALNAQQIHIVRQDALKFLQQAERQFDVIFLDPPFDTDLLEHALSSLVTHKLMTSSALLYIESSARSERPHRLFPVNCTHEKTAGQVRYGLYHPAIHGKQQRNAKGVS